MKRSGTQSLRNIILVGGLTAALIPVVILGIGSALAFRSLAIRDNVERGQQAAESLAQRFDQIIADQRDMLSILGRDIGRATTRDAIETDSMLAAALPHARFALRLVVIDPEGVGVAAHSAPGAPEAALVGLDLHDRDFFQQVVASKAPVVQRNIAIGRATGVASIVVAAPILDPAGALKGVLVESLDLSALQKQASDIRIGSSGRAIVTDGGGTLIAHPVAAAMRQNTNYAGLPIWKQLSSGDSGPLDAFADSDGRERIGGFATVPASGWKIWVSRTRSEINDQVMRVFLQVGAWVVAAIVLAVIGSYLMARSISRPIEALRATARRITDGDLEARAAERGPEDVVALSRTMNAMANSIPGPGQSERNSAQRLQDAVRTYGAFAERVAAGDLAARIAVQGEDDLAILGTGLNKMTESLRGLVGEIRSATNQVEAATSQILAATGQQVAATSEQAAGVRETATTVAQVRQTAEVAARKTKGVSELAQKIESTAQSGREAVANSIRGSEEAREKIEALAQRILGFSDQAQEIAEINATVSDLAEQSNLLAVNASIEAAKAGKSGRGFAVVATEIKELAERCREATAQVRRIVTDIQKSAQGAVMAAEQGVKMATQVSEVAQQSGSAIAVLAEEVVQASQAAQQINASAEQQESGMGQIALSMKSIEQASAQTVSATQQVERSARELNELARNLAKLVATTKLEYAS